MHLVACVGRGNAGVPGIPCLRHRGVELKAFHGSATLALHGNRADVAVFNEGLERSVQGLHGAEERLPP